MRDVHIERAGLVVVAIQIGEREHHVAEVRRGVRGFIFRHGVERGVNCAARLVDEVTIGTAECAARLTRGVDTGIDGLKLIETEVAIAWPENRLERIKLHEVRHDFAGGRVAVEAERLRDAQFLPVKNHRRTVDRCADAVTHECLERIVIALLVVGRGVHQHESLAVRVAAIVQKRTVIRGVHGGLEIEQNIFVEDVEVSI